MFKSKFILFALIILLISLVLAAYVVLSSDVENVESVEKSDDSGFILIQDDNGSVHLSKVSHTYEEGSASALD